MTIQGSISDRQIDEIGQVVATHGKIAAIKLVKQRWHVSLLDAKRIVEACDFPPARPPISRPQMQPLAHTEFNTQSRRTFGYTATILLVIGLGFCTLSVWIWHANQKFEQRALRVQGEVIAMRGTGGSSSVPVVGYQWEGQPRRWTSSIGSNPPSYQVGDRVALLVDPDAPSSAAIVDFTHRWLAVVVSGLIAAVLIAMAAVFVKFG